MKGKRVPNNNQGGRLDDIESMQRIEFIYDMISSGFMRGTIVLQCSKLWNISYRQVDKYIARAKKIFEDVHIENVKERYRNALKRTRALYRQCMASGDKRTAANVLRELNDLEGCKTIKVEHSGSIDGAKLDNLSLNQLKAIESILKGASDGKDSDTTT